jgi:SAM-dependent methyltransferase
MLRADWSRIAHEGMEVMNPIPAAKLEAALGALGPVEGARAIDLGCGKGDLLARLEARGCSGVGVDLSGDLLAEARLRAPASTFVEADVTAFETSDRFDIAASIGSPATLEQLLGLVGGGGFVLYGEGYWRRAPSREYLEALGATEDELTDYDGLARAGRLVHAETASVEDFDRYEERWAANGEAYATAHPDEPGVEEFAAWIRNGRRRYLELGGRETLGFGVFVYRA